MLPAIVGMFALILIAFILFLSFCLIVALHLFGLLIKISIKI